MTIQHWRRERFAFSYEERRDPQNGVWWQWEQGRALTDTDVGSVLLRNRTLGLGTWCPWALVVAELTQKLSLPPSVRHSTPLTGLGFGVCRREGTSL